MKATLVIGLGGTGTLTCKLTKKLFLEEFGGEEKMPANVKFLCIDTRATAEKEEDWYRGLPSDDSVNKKVAGIISEKDFKVMQGNLYLRRNPQIKEWLKAPLPIKNVAEAWEIRQAGRLAFWRHRKAIANIQGAIYSLIEFLKLLETKGQLSEHISLEKGLDIFIINSLAGGTGSGMFFDVAGLIKKKCQQEAEITLLSLLPDLFVPHIDLDRSIAQLYTNTYAALKELNHYMRDRESEIDHRWMVSYSKDDEVCIGQKIENQSASLFDNVYLVDQQNRNDESLRDRLLILPLIAKYIYNSIVRFGPALRHSRGTEEKALKPEQWCSGLGCSILSFPLEEIREVCIYRLLKEVVDEAHRGKDYSSKGAGDNAKDMIKAGNDFDYQGWMRRLKDRINYYPQTARSIITGGRRAYYNNLDQYIVRSLRRELDSDIRLIKKNYPTVLKEVKAALKRIVDEAIGQKGLRYAKDLLGRLKEELNFYEKIDDEIEKLEKTIKTKDDEIAPKLKSVKQICEKVVDFTRWGVYAEKNLQPLINDIATLTGNKLKKEKLFYVSKILKELVEDGRTIDKEIKLITDCLDNLKELKNDFTEAEKVALGVLHFSAVKEDKKGRAPEKVDKFYKEHFSKEKSELERKIREELKKGKPIKGEGLKQYLEKQLERLSRLTLKDIIPESEMEIEIIRGLKASQAFWKHDFGEVRTETFIISGFEHDEMEQYISSASLTSTSINTIITPVDSPDTIAKKQREIAFITVESGVPIAEVRGLEIWESNYRKHNPRKNWEIHLTRPAVDFGELLLGPGMGEERDLLMTCRDFGVVQQHGNSYQYKKEGESEEIAKGYDNTLKKLQEDPSLCETLINILKREISDASGEEIEDYLKNHHGYSKDKFLKNHKNRYKDKGSGKPIPSHEIPSYIKKELEKRLGI